MFVRSCWSFVRFCTSCPLPSVYACECPLLSVYVIMRCAVEVKSSSQTERSDGTTSKGLIRVSVSDRIKAAGCESVTARFTFFYPSCTPTPYHARPPHASSFAPSPKPESTHICKRWGEYKSRRQRVTAAYVAIEIINGPFRCCSTMLIRCGLVC